MHFERAFGSPTIPAPQSLLESRHDRFENREGVSDPRPVENPVLGISGETLPGPESGHEPTLGDGEM